MGIKHFTPKVSGDKGYATEWNANHKIDGNVDFEQWQAENLLIHQGDVFPASPAEGQMFYNTALKTLYFYDGDNWVAWIEATAKYELYITGDDTQDNVYGDNWRAQTFTTGTVSTVEKVVLRSVKLKLYRVLSPGTVYVALKAVDGANKPTGPDLATGIINGYSITEDLAGGWYDIVMSPYEMQKSTKYAIVARVPGGNATNYLCWRIDSAGATYAGGSKITSADAGFTWTIVAASDFMFEVWGTRVYELVWEVDGADLQMTTARPMDMRTQQIHNVVDPTAAQDAATKNFNEAVQTTSVLTKLGAQSQNLNMNTNKIVNVVNPAAAQDAATKNWCETAQTDSVLTKLGAQAQNLNMNSNKIVNLAAPTVAGDAIRKETKTLYWSANGNLFLGQFQTSTYERRPSRLNVLTAAVNWYVPVNLPHGAIVTRVLVTGDATMNAIVFELYRCWSGAVAEELASSTVNTADTTIINATIDNNAYYYRLVVQSPPVNGQIWGAFITYTLDDPYS